MRDRKPIAVFVREDHVRWRIELWDVTAVRHTLGEELVSAFCRCSVHADRLRSVLDLTYLSRLNYREGTNGSSRNLEALAAYGCRTLCDLTLAIRTLLDAAATQGVLDHSTAPWAAIEAFVHRWDRDPSYLVLREAASRDERTTIERGLSTLEPTRTAVLCHGRGALFQQCESVLGPRALAAGSGVTEGDVKGFLGALSEHGLLGTTIHEAFILALQAKGVLLDEMPIPSVSAGEPV